MTDSLEATDQGHRRKCFSKKRSSKIFFRRSPKEENKKGLCKFSARFLAFSYNLKNEQIPTIVETDANAHHAIWRFSDINPRGEDLLAYCGSADLNFCSVGSKPTFRS